MLRGGSGSHDDVPSRRWRPRGRIAGARRHRRDYTQITAEFEAIRTASRPNALKIIMRWPRRASTQVFLVRAQDMDNIINVEVASEFPGGLGYSYFPAAFVLEIGYKQVTALTQRLQ